MTVESSALLKFDPMSKKRTHSPQLHRPHSMAEMKARQAIKIREIAEALVSEGFDTLDAQARALGLGRSTAWTILKSNHKGSGLSAKIINRVLANRQLPRLVRARILEYVEDKATGRHGHSVKLRRKFITALSVATRVRSEKAQARIAKRDASSASRPLAGNSHTVDSNRSSARIRRAG